MTGPLPPKPLRPLRAISFLRRTFGIGGVITAALVATAFVLPFHMTTKVVTGGHFERAQETWALWLFAWAAALSFGALTAYWSSGFAQGFGWAKRRPITALATCAALAVAIQCHPVIFMGRSFVSPNNGSPMLYQGHPTVPKSTDAHLEDAKGSDVAAMFHQSLYYPSIQREALFEHLELPLWNRYFMSGVPLLGQGQSMFGSLLNIIPLVGDASATSWDIRYVVNRWLFSFTVGLSVWLLTGSLGSGAALSVIAVFIGFFAFRLNHMAQFSLESAPLIALGWIILAKATTSRGCAVALLLILGAHWEVMNSGTVKEAYSFILFLDFAGALLLVSATLSSWLKVRRLLWASAAGAVFILISAPVWSTLLSTLAHSFTDSQRVNVHQAPLWQIIGFFEDQFYANLDANEARVLPSTNLLVLLLMSAAVVQLRHKPRNGPVWSLLVVFLFAAALGFNVVSPLNIREWPFFSHIHHLHNVASGVMILTGVLLAGFGVSALKETIADDRWRLDAPLTLGLAAAPILAYFSYTERVTGRPFFNGYLLAHLVALAAGLLAVFFWRRQRRPAVLAIAMAGLLFTGLWRHAQSTSTRFDAYVFNPQPRVDFRASSPAVAAIDAQMSTTPARPAGIGHVIFAGYSQMLGWESAFGVDAVRSPYYDELAANASLNKLLWVLPDRLRELGGEPGVWHENNLTRLLPIHDLLNVRFYLAPLGWRPQPAGSLEERGRYDLGVYESPTAWPRAFFANRVVHYDGIAQFVGRLQRPGDRKPFAAIERRDAVREGIETVGLQKDLQREIRPAQNYILTANTTTFEVEAPSAGVAVLTENFVPDAFRAYVNGVRTPVLRLNHAFKGVALPHAGRFTVRFEYWPPYLTPALIASVAGAVLGAALLGFLWIKRS